jgi:hypothetical protein
VAKAAKAAKVAKAGGAEGEGDAVEGEGDVDEGDDLAPLPIQGTGSRRLHGRRRREGEEKPRKKLVAEEVVDLGAEELPYKSPFVEDDDDSVSSASSLGLSKSLEHDLFCIEVAAFVDTVIAVGTASVMGRQHEDVNEQMCLAVALQMQKQTKIGLLKALKEQYVCVRGGGERNKGAQCVRAERAQKRCRARG